MRAADATAAIALARQIVGAEFGAKEAQDLPIDDLLELAEIISAEAVRNEAETHDPACICPACETHPFGFCGGPRCHCAEPPFGAA